MKPGNKTSFRSEMSPKTVAREALEVGPKWKSLNREREREREGGRKGDEDDVGSRVWGMQKGGGGWRVNP